MRKEMLKYRINSKSQVKSPGLDALWASSYNLQLAWDSKNYENCKTRKKLTAKLPLKNCMILHMIDKCLKFCISELTKYSPSLIMSN